MMNNHPRNTIAIWLLAGATVLYAQPAADQALQQFIQAHIAKLQPLADQAALAYWDGATTGRPEAFARLKAWRTSGAIREPLLKRQLDKLYFAYLRCQIPPDLLKRMVTLDNQIQEAYNNYRGHVNGEPVTMSEIYTAMTTEKDMHRREQIWRASKEVGNVIAGDLLELVRLRNQAARAVGYDNYHTLSVACSEQSVSQIDAIFSELDRLTEAPFRNLKKELDAVLAADYGISPNDLMPWHYHDPFFQRTPLVYDLDLDALYAKADIKDLAQRYYAGVGLPIDDILARSDLYDREGKYPHAFSFEANRDGDVRVLCNLQNTERWAETALHELGHAVYSKYHDRSEPWLLREPAHAFTTEAVAMFFGRLSRNAHWMQVMLGLSDAQTARIDRVSTKYLRFQQVLVARWVMVMYEFEKQLYANPDQDLNTLWWDLVGHYQLLQRPPGKPDAGWASKLHFTTAPCYYHNYLLGELLASQFYYHIVSDILKRDPNDGLSLCNDPRIGQYFREQVFAPGAVYPWNEMIKRATGSGLDPKYFVRQFVE